MEEQRQEHGSRMISGIMERMERIRRFSGPPGEFWPAFLEEAAHLIGAVRGFLVLRDEDGGAWRRLLAWPAGPHGSAKNPGLDARIDDIALGCVSQGFALEDPGSRRDKRTDGTVIGVRLMIEEHRVSVAVFLLPFDASLVPEEAVMRLTLIADTPSVYQLGHLVDRAKSDVVRFAEALDLLVLLNDESRYLAAAMTFCNELAARYRCDRVSLGWLKEAYIRVQAVSHLERFEKKMDVVQSLERAMEEAFDQDEEILLPLPEGSNAVVRDHEAFSREQGSPYIVSLPMRINNEPVGVLMCERSSGPFTEEEVRGLRVICDQSVRRLGDLERSDRWFGARMAQASREWLAKLFGVEHTFAKLLGVIICLLVAFLVFGKLNYRVESPFILKTDDLAYLPAPFDGYIESVYVKVGDRIPAGGPLLALDTRELILDASSASANQNRYRREAEKARASNALADMKVAMSLEEQANARMKLIAYQIEHARLKAPFAGIVVEGDLKELLGAPVKKGDILFKVARIEKLYVELKVDENDIHEISGGNIGEVSFISRPDLTFPIKVERIDPVAVTQERENIFLVRAAFLDPIRPWWRPGMSGVAKIDIGKRNVLWIFTHKTIDVLRIFFWW